MMRYSIRDVSRFAAGVHQPDGRLSGISGHLHSGLGQDDTSTPFDWSSLDPLIHAGGTIAETVIRATTARPAAPAGYAYNSAGALVPIAGAPSSFAGLSPMLLLGGGALLFFALSRK